jgi:hypothetical protein
MLFNNNSLGNTQAPGFYGNGGYKGGYSSRGRGRKSYKGYNKRGGFVFIAKGDYSFLNA